MTLAETFALVSFSLFSYADLRYRRVLGIEVFLFGTILLTLPATPIQTGTVYWRVLGASSAIYLDGFHRQGRLTGDQWAGLSFPFFRRPAFPL